MSVNEKMTAIAEAIRLYAEHNNPLGLDAMASGVHDVFNAGVREGKSNGYDEGFIAGKASVPFEVHKITIATDLVSGNNTILSDNEFVKQHCDNENFTIQLISLTPQSGEIAIGYAYHGNRMVVGSYYGLSMQSNTTGQITKVTGGRADSGGTHGIPYANKESGNVIIPNNTASGVLKAGDYLLILSVAEVAE